MHRGHHDVRHVLLLVLVITKQLDVAGWYYHRSQLFLHGGHLGWVHLRVEHDWLARDVRDFREEILSQAAQGVQSVFCHRHRDVGPDPGRGPYAPQVARADGAHGGLLVAAGIGVLPRGAVLPADGRQAVRAVPAAGLHGVRGRRGRRRSVPLSDGVLRPDFVSRPRPVRAAHPHGQPARGLGRRAPGDEPEGVLAVHALHLFVSTRRLRLHAIPAQRVQVLLVGLLGRHVLFFGQNEPPRAAARSLRRCARRSGGRTPGQMGARPAGRGVQGIRGRAGVRGAVQRQREGQGQGQGRGQRQDAEERHVQGRGDVPGGLGGGVRAVHRRVQRGASHPPRRLDHGPFRHPVRRRRLLLLLPQAG
mmetsp:Transcript_27661/g.83426  ORF Transcript_27661/g.83426 Transcript_27661/m.83426 type:complete len:362 (+) Transcript_27661:491-1576(+)